MGDQEELEAQYSELRSKVKKVMNDAEEARNEKVAAQTKLKALKVAYISYIQCVNCVRLNSRRLAQSENKQRVS